MSIRMFCAGVGLGALVGCTAAQPSLSDSERAALRDTIVQRMNSYASAINTLDPERVAPLYAENPDFRLYSDGQAFDRAGLLAFIDQSRRVLRSFEATWDTIEVTPLGRDAALAAARFHRALTDTSGVARRDWGTVTWVWVRDGGQWRLIHGQGVHYPDTTR